MKSNPVFPLLYSASFLSMALPLVAAEKSGNSSDRPNIIFILCDDMGYGDLACYGQKYIQTPNLVTWPVTDRNIFKLPIWIVWLPRVCFLRKLMQGALSVRPHVPH